MARIILTDAGPLIGLGHVCGLDWRHALSGEVWMPEEVRAKVTGDRGFEGEAACIRIATEALKTVPQRVGE